jgi:carbohydrate-selective porin OprB
LPWACPASDVSLTTNSRPTGIVSGDPSDAAKREEILLEIFWRIQLIPFVAVTPDIHFVFNPSDNPARARIVVVGIRLQLDF